MLDWLKALLGDACTPELDAAVSQELEKRYVSRGDFDAKSTRVAELETQVSQLTQSVQTRDAQLEELKKSAGSGEELQRQIETLTQQNQEQKAAYEKELAQVRLTAAVDAELTAAGSRNLTAVRAVLAEFLEGAKIVDGKVIAKVDGESVALSSQIERMKKDAATDFLFGAVTREGWKPGESSDGGKPGGDKQPSEMSYAELSAFLSEHPDAKLD